MFVILTQLLLHLETILVKNVAWVSEMIRYLLLSNKRAVLFVYIPRQWP